MRSEFRLPALGADMDEGTLLEWHVAPGARVKRGDVVAVVETDKGAIDVEIFLEGVVSEIVVAPGTKVPVGTVLALLETEGEAAAAAPADERQAAPAPVAAPAGQGRVDVAPVAAAAEGLKIPAAPSHQTRQPDVPAAAPGAVGAPGMRDAIAAAMSKSKREIPHYYLSTTVDVTPATDWLAEHNASVPVTQRLLFAALLLKAVALAGRGMKGFSGFYRDGRYEQGPAVHVGVAVALRGGGLVAPAIMDTADKPLVALMDDFRALVTRARAGRLRASELAAPTIILTSLGDASVDAVFPIIQPPQVAIVGAGAVVERPWAVDGKVVPRQVLTLSLGADHRVTDGRLGAQFLARITALLADPRSL
jgi:pyruvate dehydrogenase E2 component (dihydrolipoamide acetyltransferase)